MISLSERQLNNNTVVIRVDADYAYLSDPCDIHYDALLHDEKALDRFIEMVFYTPNFYVPIGGDSTENAVLGSKSSVYDERYSGIDQLLRLRDKLKPINDRIPFVKSGNHGYDRAIKSNKMPPEQILAEFLGVPFVRGIGTVIMNVRKNTYVASCFHTRTKQEEKYDWLNSDIVFTEHLHQKTFNRLPIASVNRFSKTWVLRDKLYVRSGSFLSWGGYAMEKYRPLISDGCPIIRLSGITNKWDMRVFERVQDLKEDLKENK